MVRIENVSLLSVKTALSNFGSTVKKIVPNNWINQNQPPVKNDEFKNTGSDPIPPEKRILAAVIKSNEANKERLIAEINRSGEFDSVYDKILPEYQAYKNPELLDVTFNPISSDTVIVTYKG